jgi:Mitochondrial carrier protein
MAGGVAGAVSRTIVSPLERLKILLQIQSVGREEYKLSIWKGLVKMGREEGWRGFMRGNGTNCIRIIPYSAVQFGSYNFYKKVSACIASQETPRLLECLVLISSSLPNLPMVTCHRVVVLCAAQPLVSHPSHLHIR